MPPPAPLYRTDLAYIHDAAFGDLANGAAPELVRLLRGRGFRGGHVVDAGCGSGILAAHLTRAGFRVTGIDASAAMVRMARRRAPRARFRVGSLATAALPRCEAVVAVGEVISYLRSWRSVRRFFTRVHRALGIGGVFVFDFMESADRRTYPPRSRAGADGALVASAAASRDGRTLTRRLTMFRKVDGTYRRSREVHRVRIYPRREIARALAAAGFAVSMRRSYGAYRLLPGDLAAVAVKL